MCFWKKKTTTILKSEEYTELFQKIDKLRVQVQSLEIDLQLYVKKLKASKGLEKKEEVEDTEKINNPVILPI